MPVCCAGDGSGLLVFNYQGQARVESEFLPERLCSLLELVLRHGDGGCDDEVPKCVHPAEPAGVIDGIVQITNRPAHDHNFLIVVASQQVLGQGPTTRCRTNSCRLDQHGGYRPNNVWAS
jgi:hypothetical protein